jgi:hypothetical protein
MLHCTICGEELAETELYFGYADDKVHPACHVKEAKNVQPDDIKRLLHATATGIQTFLTIYDGPELYLSHILDVMSRM